MKTTTQYVVGFAYTSDQQVLLVKKNRPPWQAGKLNGIGGKIEPVESPLAAMQREAAEETGLCISWSHRGVMRGTNTDGTQFECHVFYAYTNCVYGFKQIEDEHLSLYTVPRALSLPHIPNLSVLLPLGLLNDGCTFTTLEYGRV